MQEIELSPDELEQIGLTLRAARVVHGATMKQLAHLLFVKYRFICTPSTVWTLFELSAPPGRFNFAGRDPGHRGKPRNGRRQRHWYTYPRTIGRGLR